MLQVLPHVPGQEGSALPESQQEAVAALADCDALGTLRQNEVHAHVWCTICNHMYV
jgi:hypothetical protein